VGVRSSRYKLGSSRLVGRVERDVGRQVFFYQAFGAMPCGKEDGGRDEGARADGDALAFEKDEVRMYGLSEVGSARGKVEAL
jgi:hypothetical protein